MFYVAFCIYQSQRINTQRGTYLAQRWGSMLRVDASPSSEWLPTKGRQMVYKQCGIPGSPARPMSKTAVLKAEVGWPHVGLMGIVGLRVHTKLRPHFGYIT
jgi:hypothetical protein